MNRIKRYILLLVLPGLLPAAVKPQIHYLVKGESGIYRTDSQINGLGALDFSLKYAQKFSGVQLNSWLRIRPEIWDAGAMSGSHKQFAGISLRRASKRLHFGALFSINSANYFNFNIDYAYTFVRSRIFVTGKMAGKIQWLLGGEYFYRDYQNIFQFQTDGLKFNAGLTQYFSNRSKIFLQFTATKFYIQPENRSKFSGIRTKNSGQQFGPELSFQTGRRAIFSVSSSLLFHRSDVVRPGKFLQQFSFSYIRPVSANLHLLLYAGFSRLNFTLPQENDRWLLFFSTESRSRIFAKLEKDLNKSLALYTRVGLIKEELIWNTLTLTGRQVIFGVKYHR